MSQHTWRFSRAQGFKKWKFVFPIRKANRHIQNRPPCLTYCGQTLKCREDARGFPETNLSREAFPAEEELKAMFKPPQPSRYLWGYHSSDFPPAACRQHYLLPCTESCKETQGNNRNTRSCPKTTAHFWFGLNLNYSKLLFNVGRTQGKKCQSFSLKVYEKNSQ